MTEHTDGLSIDCKTYVLLLKVGSNHWTELWAGMQDWTEWIVEQKVKLTLVCSNHTGTLE